MSRYPELNYKIIANCIKSIDSDEFDTYDFIAILKIVDSDFVNMVSGIGDGWRSIVGRNLSKYAVETQKIKKKTRKGNAQLWGKNN